MLIGFASLYLLIASVVAFALHNPEQFKKTPNARTVWFLLSTFWPIPVAILLLCLLGLGIAGLFLYPMMLWEERRRAR